MFQIAREHDITLKAMILGALKDKYPSLRHHGRRPGRQAPPSLREHQSELTPQIAIENLLESDEWPGTDDPQKAAQIIVQWLTDSGFQITDAPLVDY